MTIAVRLMQRPHVEHLHFLVTKNTRLPSLNIEYDRIQVSSSMIVNDRIRSYLLHSWAIVYDRIRSYTTVVLNDLIRLPSSTIVYDRIRLLKMVVVSQPTNYLNATLYLRCKRLQQRCCNVANRCDSDPFPVAATLQNNVAATLLQRCSNVAAATLQQRCSEVILQRCSNRKRIWIAPIYNVAATLLQHL